MGNPVAVARDRKSCRNMKMCPYYVETDRRCWRHPDSHPLVDPVGSVPCVKEEMVLCYRRRKEMASRPFPREYWWNRADTLEFEFLPSADSRGKSFCISCTNSLILLIIFLIIAQKIKRMGVLCCCNLDDPLPFHTRVVTKSLSKPPLGVIRKKHGRCVGRCVLHYPTYSTLVGSWKKTRLDGADD